MKKIFIFGITGSIGTQTLEVLNRENFKKEFKLIGGTINSNFKKAKKIIEKYNLEFLYINDYKEKGSLPQKYRNCNIITNYQKLEEYLEFKNPEISLIATSGFAGLKNTLTSIKFSKRLCIANKESLVSGGDIVIKKIKEKNIELLPVDSEHSAIFQLLEGEKSPSNLIITASGGSLRNTPIEELKNVTIEKVLNHPVWNMGKRITVDSATMVNKGLEVIEAYYLFDKPKIDVIINENSHIHSIIYFEDGTMKLHYGKPDMKIPIAYSLTYPKRSYKDEMIPLKNIEFKKVDYQRYPSLKLAFEILGNQKLHIAYNSIDEELVELFLNKKIKFTDISNILKKCILEIDKINIKINDIEDIYETDKISRNILKQYINN
ncbi:MAG: 1-deoxy-D-xylulose-5-phosphate reductoisomerase [Oceanotoga sp.]|uniref:1-deoxy-D-xylulose-5-phosphate reductoisomerase n=1 Tax=Oceanotoga sp. TaxID=2108366 RepID=UPI002651FB41|nr:1-deoxy-D-xylulose-5-phosphate reductoisomerase [Oceanotoga sp.]MDN5341468.1 1-deoxy-D-xylulose-5-phosphate reductoisomerase [Oceanotoga sp.]